jgi:adenylate cyclase
MVVADIAGVKKFQYDIWGDTVNTASRMESAGDAGRVNISEATYLAIQDNADFSFMPRGMVSVKGKGEVEMWFVERVVGSLDRKPSVEGVGGNQDLSRG